MTEQKLQIPCLQTKGGRQCMQSESRWETADWSRVKRTQDEALVSRWVADRPTLLSLLIVSRYVYVETEPIFYENIYFVGLGTKSHGTSVALRLQKFHESISASGGRLAYYVKQLTVLPVAYPFPLDALECLEHILRRLVNLKSFTFDFGVVASLGQRCRLLRTLSSDEIPFSLNYFYWSHFDHDNDALITILQSQQSLHRLEMPWSDHPLLLSACALPHLRILHCGMRLALSILPGRNVTHLKSSFIYGELDHSPSARVLDSIRVFCGRGSCASIITLASLMPCLEYLELQAVDLRFTDLSVLFRYIRNLEASQIRYLRVTSDHSYYSVAPNAAWLCFKLLPSLYCVEFQKTRDGVYDRWYRHGTAPTSIEWPRGWDWVSDWEAGYRVIETSD